MEEHQNVRLSTGPSELNRSYYTGNSFSALQSSQQFHDDRVSTSAHPLVSSQKINDTTPPCSALGPQLLHGHIGSPVLAGPTRKVTGEAMPTSLAEALTLLSFLKFVQRCNLLIALFQPTQLLVPIALLGAVVQTTPPCEVSQDASTQPSDQPVSSLSLNVTVQTISHATHTSSLDAAVQTIPHSTLSQHVSTQMGSRSASMCLFRLLYAAMRHTMLPHNYRSRSSLLDVSTRTIPWTAKTLFVSPRHQYKVHVPCCSRRQDSNSQPHLLILLLALTCLLHMVAPTISFPSHALQPPVSTTLVGTHPVRSAKSAKRSASTALAGTHNPVGSDPCTGIQARRAEIPPTLSPLPVESFMRLSSKKPMTMFRTSRNTDLAILLNKDTFEPDPIVLTFKRYLGYGLAHCSRPPETSISLWFTDCYLLLSTHSQCRG